MSYQPKIAFVHDYLNEFGGAERVLLALSEIYPDAPIYTAFYREGSPSFRRFKGKKIVTSWAQKVPFFVSKLHSPLRFLAPFIWGGGFSAKGRPSFGWDFSEFDVVIGSSNWYVTKGFRKGDTRHVTRNTKSFVEICYCHTPPRYLYGYPTASSLQKYFLVRVYALLVNHFMRVYDFEAAQRVDWFIANSKEVAARIKKFYRRESTVIYPPIDVNRLSTIVNRKNTKTMNNEPSTMNSYFLVVSRLVGAKNVDIAVEVCRNLKLPLKIVGTGREMQVLKKLAGEALITNDYSSSEPFEFFQGKLRESRSSSTESSSRQARTTSGWIEFLGDVDDDQLVKLYQNCRALIFCGSQEDFGIVPVEAMAAGKPVIALSEGGVKETVIDGKTGLWVENLTPGEFVIALNRFLEMEKKGQWDEEFIREHAEKFSKERFKREIKKFVESKVK